jgi:hypothetical protein
MINQNQIQVPEGNSSPRGCKNGNAFHPSFYMGLLAEGNVPKGTKAYSEKDLGSTMESIIKGEFELKRVITQRSDKFFCISST